MVPPFFDYSIKNPARDGTNNYKIILIRTLSFDDIRCYLFTGLPPSPLFIMYKIIFLRGCDSFGRKPNVGRMYKLTNNYSKHPNICQIMGGRVKY